MATYVALLRAINVGGTGALAMSDLKTLCTEAGFKNVRTFIQSGNVILESAASERSVKAKLERAVTARLGKPTAALVRTPAELGRTLDANPFVDADPRRVIVFFLDEPPPRDALKTVQIPGREEVAARGREIFVHYPDGQGRSKLKLPVAQSGTGRNLNTVAKLLELARRGPLSTGSSAVS